MANPANAIPAAIPAANSGPFRSGAKPGCCRNQLPTTTHKQTTIPPIERTKNGLIHQPATKKARPTRARLTINALPERPRVFVVITGIYPRSCGNVVSGTSLIDPIRPDRVYVDQLMGARDLDLNSYPHRMHPFQPGAIRGDRTTGLKKRLPSNSNSHRLPEKRERNRPTLRVAI